MRNVQPLTLALDWNGTVVDDAARAHEALRAVLGPGGQAPPDLDAFRQGFRMALRQRFTGLGVPSPHLGRTEARWNDEMCRRLAPLSRGAGPLLTCCSARGIRVCVVTGAQRRLVETDARRLAVRHLLDEIVAAHPKSSPLRRWRLDGDVRYVGDTECDLAEARRAEVTPIAFARGYRPRQCLRAREPAAIVDDLIELIPLLEAGLAVEGGDAGRESAVPEGSHGH